MRNLSTEVSRIIDWCFWFISLTETIVPSLIAPTTVSKDLVHQKSLSKSCSVLEILKPIDFLYVILECNAFTLRWIIILMSLMGHEKL